METTDTKTLICKNFMYNKCERGNTCKYIHNTKVCFHFWKHNNCKFGDECRKLHNFENLTTDNDNKNTNKRPAKKKNTECFEPMTKPVDMRIVCDNGNSTDKASVPLTTRDVLLAPNVFNDFAPGELYNRLVEELNSCGVPPEKLLKMWHGNDKIEGTHLIADLGKFAVVDRNGPVKSVNQPFARVDYEHAFGWATKLIAQRIETL